MNEDFHLYLDSADLTELQACLPHPVVHGVTTNPTLLQRAGVGRGEVPGLLKRCIELGARQVQAQVYSSEVDGKAVKVGWEGTNYGFRTDAVYTGNELAQGSDCKMVRP